MAQLIKNLPAVQETLVRSLVQEDPLEKEMATHSCILAWRIPWTEQPGGLQSMGSQESNTTLQLNHQATGIYCIAQGTILNILLKKKKRQCWYLLFQEALLQWKSWVVCPFSALCLPPGAQACY